MPQVPQHFEVGRKILELLVNLGADPLALLAAGRPRFIREIMLDLDPFQVRWQQLATMPMTVLYAADKQLLAGFFGDARVARELQPSPAA